MNDRDELSALLRRWRHDPAPDPRFAAGVWQHIRTAEPVASPSRAGELLRFPLRFALPIAAGFAVILGITAGLASSRSQATERMATAYARTIDPILMTSAGSAETHSSHP